MAEGNGEDLERRLDRLEAENQILKEKVEELGPSEWTRRGVLGALGVGGLALASGSAAADGPTSGESGSIGSGNVDWDVQDLSATTVATDQILGTVAGGDTITNLAGTNLSIDSNGNLNASGGSSSESRLTTTYYVYKDGGGTIHVLGRSGELSSGSDAATQIQNAVDNLPDTGGKILIEEGQYSISSTISWESPKDDVHIEGVYQGTGDGGNLQGETNNGVKLKATTAAPIFNINSTGADASDKIFYSLKNLYLVGTGDGNSTSAIECHWTDQSAFTRLFVSFFQNGMTMHDRCNAYNIRQCIFIDVDVGVQHFGGNKPQFYHNKFLNSTGHGLEIDATQSGAADINKAIILGNDFHNNGNVGTGNVGHGIVTSGTVDLLLIASNVIDGGTGDGILLNSSTTRSSIVNNYVDAHDGRGINVTGTDNTIVGNVTQSNGSDGIRVDARCAVIGNVSEDNSGTDIVVDANADGAVIGSNVNATRTVNGANTKYNGTTYIQSTSPSGPKTNDLWVDTS